MRVIGGELRGGDAQWANWEVAGSGRHNVQLEGGFGLLLVKSASWLILCYDFGEKCPEVDIVGS